MITAGLSGSVAACAPGNMDPKVPGYGAAPMQPTQRFADLMELPAASVPLDEAAFLIAAHAHPGLDVGAQLARLDDLAMRCLDPSRDGVLAHLFGAEGFRGNDADYYDPDNSMLDRVLDRRRGIPITLSVVLIEVGRRLGVPFTGIGAPGHFIVRHDGSGVYIDPFNGGRVLDDTERGPAVRRRAARAERLDRHRVSDARQPEGDLRPEGRRRLAPVGDPVAGAAARRPGQRARRAEAPPGSPQLDALN